MEKEGGSKKQRKYNIQNTSVINKVIKEVIKEEKMKQYRKKGRKENQTNKERKNGHDT